jgi:hypothetical protein
MACALLKDGRNASHEPERLGAVGQGDEKARNVRALAINCSTANAQLNLN